VHLTADKKPTGKNINEKFKDHICRCGALWAVVLWRHCV